MFSSQFLPQTTPYPTSPPPQTQSLAYQVYNIDDKFPPSLYPTPTDSLFHSDLPREKPEFPFFSQQALTAHNRRMIIPYKKQSRSPGSQNNRVITSSSPTSTGLSSMRDEPLVMYRFFEFYCATCEQAWLSPLYRAKDGLFCRICHQFCQPRGIRHSFTPYLGKETCYGKYLCHNCNRGFSSYKSLSNCPDQCFQCGTLVYPYYQIAHSVLYQKIRKNDKNSIFDMNANPRSQNSQGKSGSRSQSQHRNRHYVRKIASGIITSSSSAKQASNKKRLHCLNNEQLNNIASSIQGRRQVQLKTCYSEPTIIGNNTF